MPVAGKLTGYEALPETVRAMVSRAEWAWMNDDQKARLQRSLTTPIDAEEELPDA